MKRLFLLLSCLFITDVISAQNDVYVEITDMNIPALRHTMETNTARLHTVINKAQSRNSSMVNFSGIGITEDAKDAIMMLWENVHMRVLDDEIVARCISLRSSNRTRGYEISNIAIEMLPTEANYSGDRNQEVTISYDLQGRISDFVISSGIHQYTTLMKNAIDLDDLDKRMQILHYVEQFRTAYCQKDMQFMDNVFSEDALIIIGRRVLRKRTETGMQSKFEYTKQNKEQYLTNLGRLFKSTKYVNVKFSDITIERNGAKPHLYGVTCIQDWNSASLSGTQYSDMGRVVMRWEFSDEDHPVIHVRTWQSTEDDKWFRTNDFKIN